jgi:hypothetical protein
MAALELRNSRYSSARARSRTDHDAWPWFFTRLMRSKVMLAAERPIVHSWILDFKGFYFSGQPPCFSITASISFISRMVSERAMMIFDSG